MTTAAISPVLFALGTVTTVVSFFVLTTALGAIGIIVRRAVRRPPAAHA